MSTDHRATRPIVAAAAVALLVPALVAVPTGSAAATDGGLFGSQDPTYDGVYRQGLAITGLAAADRSIPHTAVKWLLRQQCGNGAFQPYRANLRVGCVRPDPTTFTGPDSNSTALGAMALWVADERDRARDAARYLRGLRNYDGGFAYYRGGLSDTNSTGLAIAALRSVRVRGAKAALIGARKYLRRTQLRCTAPAADRGLLSYQTSPKTANFLATAQGALGLVTTFPASITGNGRETPRLQCTSTARARRTSVTDAAIDGLQRQLHTGNGLLPNQFGGGSDYSATAQAAIALASAGRSKQTVRTAQRALRRNVDAYTAADTATPIPGSLGTLLNLTGVTGANPTRFGGVNLIRELRSTLRGPAR